MPKPILICIGGSIGSGKSTFSEYLAKHMRNKQFKYKLYAEPIPKALLDLFLTNLSSEENKILSFAVQHTYNASRFRDLVLGSHCKVDYVIQDQGLWFDKAFMLALKDTMSAEEFTLYSKLIDQRIDKLKNMYSEIRIVFLDQSSEVCVSNIKRRERENEDNYKSVYIETVTKHMKKVFQDIVDADQIKTYRFEFGAPTRNVGKNRNILTKACDEVLKAIVTKS